MNAIASLLTGYVVVGFPADTSFGGYFTISYIGGVTVAIAYAAFFWPRLGAMARHRNWLSPNDFISDRFNSKVLRLISSMCGSAQLIMLTALEWMALKILLTILTKGDIHPNTGVWFLAGFVFLCEIMGGMSSVALTDAVQATMLVISFCLMPMLIASKWGGLDGFVSPDCSNKKVMYTAWPISPPEWSVGMDALTEVSGYQIVNGENVTFNGMYNQTVYGCIADTAPWMLLTPLPDMTKLMFSIMSVFITWPIQPMAMHRVMVAKNGSSVKWAIFAFLTFPMVIWLPGIVMGMAAKAEFPETESINAFMTICSEMFNFGGGYAIVSVLLITSSIAAFMSTSDSIVLAVSNTLTVDLIKSWLIPGKSTKFYIATSKVVSFSCIILGVFIGLYCNLTM
jgi:Na+/proline symporter